MDRFPSTDRPRHGTGGPYKWLSPLGQGTYACVWKGQARDGTVVAMKDTKMSSLDLASIAGRETLLNTMLHHTNIVELLDVFAGGATADGQDRWVLVFEFMAGDDLRAFMDQTCGSAPLPALTTRQLMQQLLSALDYLTAHNVIHRDIKPQNLLVSKDLTLKVCDFGLARFSYQEVNVFTNEIASLWYRPPDCIMGARNHSSKLDIWGAGCVFAEMLTGTPPFQGTSPAQQLCHILTVTGTPSTDELLRLQNSDLCIDLSLLPRTLYTKRPFETLPSLRHCEPAAVQLLSQMLRFLPWHRLDANEALFTPYFTTSRLTVSLPSLQAVTPSRTPQSVSPVSPSRSMPAAPPSVFGGLKTNARLVSY